MNTHHNSADARHKTQNIKPPLSRTFSPCPSPSALDGYGNGFKRSRLAPEPAHCTPPRGLWIDTHVTTQYPLGLYGYDPPLSRLHYGLTDINLIRSLFQFSHMECPQIRPDTEHPPESRIQADGRRHRVLLIVPVVACRAGGTHQRAAGGCGIKGLWRTTGLLRCFAYQSPLVAGLYMTHSGRLRDVRTGARATATEITGAQLQPGEAPGPVLLGQSRD